MTWAEFRRLAVRMRPLGGAPQADDAAEAGRCRGLALWAATHEGLPVGLAWEWAEVRSGAVALCDPMNVLSNVRLVDGAGAPLPEGERILHLNAAVHGLAWQPEVLRAATRPALAA